MQAMRPSWAQRFTVLGDTWSMRATSPGVRYSGCDCDSATKRLSLRFSSGSPRGHLTPPGSLEHVKSSESAKLPGVRIGRIIRFEETEGHRRSTRRDAD